MDFIGYKVSGIGPQILSEAVDGFLGDNPLGFYPETGLICMCGLSNCCRCWVGHLFWVEAWVFLVLLFSLHPHRWYSVHPQRWCFNGHWFMYVPAFMLCCVILLSVLNFLFCFYCVIFLDSY